VPPLISNQKVLLNPGKHPFYKHAEAQFFLALLRGKVLGRIAALVDHEHNRVHDEKTGFFGFFESIDDSAVSDKLFSAAYDWVKSRKMINFRGPVNPCQNEDCGLLVNAFDLPPVLMMPYNPPYYEQLLEGFGLKKAMDLFAYRIEASSRKPEKLVRVAELLRKKKKISVRPIDMKNFDAEAKKVWYVYNNAWSKNWGFVPMTKDEFQHLARNLKPVVDPELALMAEINGEPIGFSLALPNINEALIRLKGRLFPTGFAKLIWYSRKIRSIRIIIMGVIHEYRNQGIDAIFYLDTWRNAAKKGFTWGEMSWILENNEMMNRVAQMLGGNIYKTYRMYQKPVKP
jgi:GNAT superfamily N-acetyltransferase